MGQSDIALVRDENTAQSGVISAERHRQRHDKMYAACLSGGVEGALKEIGKTIFPWRAALLIRHKWRITADHQRA